MNRFRKIGTSLLVIGVVVAAGIGASRAFFSDTETSTGNILAAGAIDLMVDNSSYYNGVAVESSTWSLRDLTIEKFFNFLDLKPQDWGEDTISLHVNNNDAYACAQVAFAENSENGLTEPELDMNDNDTTGELAQELQVAIWADDGDNVFESDETIFTSGLASNVLGGGTLPLAQAVGGPGLFGSGPLTGSQTYYIGMYWCYGTLAAAPVAQGANSPTTNSGFTCDGTGIGNMSQSDMLVGDISFYAVQSRNNANFSCASLPSPTPVGVTVGAVLANYDAPETCDLTVDDSGDEDHSTIGAAVSAATAGQTVCVEDGTYSETVTINKSLTLASLTGASATATITGGVNIQADNVTVKGFVVNEGTLADAVLGGFYLKDPTDNTLSNIVIRDNDIDGTGSAAGSRGILNAESGTFSNVLIENNFIRNWTTGIYMSTINGVGDSNYEFTIRYNDFENLVAGIGQLNEATVMYNEFDNTAADQEAIGAGPDYDGSVVAFNNFLNGSEVIKYGVWPEHDINPPFIKAENNFWNLGGANQTHGAVDFTPEAGSQFTHN